MTYDVEDLLREGIDRITENARVPDGLLARARQHQRRQRMAIRWTAFGGTAVAAGAAVAAASGLISTAPQRPVATLRAHTTGYVVKHTEQALSAATDGGAALEEIHTTAHVAWFAVVTRQPNGGFTMTIPAPGAAATQLNVWAYAGQLRQQGRTSGGALVFDTDRTTVTSASGRQTITANGADYASRTWWHAVSTVQVGTSRPACLTTSLAPPVGGATDWSAQIHEALACGLFRVAGPERVDGTDTVKLVATRPRPGPVDIRQTLWVNPATYLPVRVSWTWPDGQGQQRGSLVGDFRWLPPSPARVRLLTTPVPAGFRQVKPAELPRPTFVYPVRVQRPTP
jgi:hypothetical protein